MIGRQQIGMLSGGRLHLQDGPIDLVIHAGGSLRNVGSAYQAAARRFSTVLDELCAELSSLRAQAVPGLTRLRGKVACRMEKAVAPYAAETFITPMAAVAGAVAEEILEAMVAAAPLRRAYVNNGGDIAIHLAPGETYAIGLITTCCNSSPQPSPSGRGSLAATAVRASPLPEGEGQRGGSQIMANGKTSLFAKTVLRAEDGIFGIATSGWGGRSFSLGIADAVTVLAKSAAEADAAATVIANAVDLPGHPAITRKSARDLQPDSDLGNSLVTCQVEDLSQREIERALQRGAYRAEDLFRSKLVRAAALHLQGVTKIAGAPLALTANPEVPIREAALT